MNYVTDRQKECLSFIYDYSTSFGFAPTLREIGEHMNIKSTNGVNDHLCALERKRMIERTAMFSRALRITQRGCEELGVEHYQNPGSLVLRGQAVMTGEEGTHTLKLNVTEQAYALITGLLDTGLFGTDHAAVAETLLYEKLREVIAQHRGRQ